jgi:hypothetical protein
MIPDAKPASSSSSPGSSSPESSRAAASAGGSSASFSTLALSIGSSAAMALGLAPNPASGQVEKDREMARFNIDLLRMLRDKTEGNLTAEEKKFLDSMISDLQLKFVQG